MSLAVSSADLGASIRRALAGLHATEQEMFETISALLEAEVTPAQVSALLIALAAKGETADELTGAAAALRAHCVPLECEHHELLDVCGTGGDGYGTFNISTTVAFVVAGAGVPVAKHGNRAMSSRCGSADVLEALGVDITMPAAKAADTLNHLGIAFLNAQAYHPAMKRVAGVRREIGVRTIFNLIGPLANPARPSHQVVGVAHPRSLSIVAQALMNLGCRRGAVVHSRDGLDEVSISSLTDVIEWHGGARNVYSIDPGEFGHAAVARDALAGGDAKHNAALLRAVLDGRSGPHRDVVVLNAALALKVAGIAPTLHTGIAFARKAIDRGAAAAKLDALIRASAP